MSLDRTAGRSGNQPWDKPLDATAPDDGFHHAEKLRGVAVTVHEPLRRPHVGLVENDVHRFARRASIERRQEREHEPPFRGFCADCAQIQNTAFGHAGDGFADQPAGMLGDRQIAARASKDDHVMRGGRRPVGEDAQPPPHAQRINDDDAAATLEHAFNHRTGGIGLAGAGRAGEAEAVVKRLVGESDVSLLVCPRGLGLIRLGGAPPFAERIQVAAAEPQLSGLSLG